MSAVRPGYKQTEVGVIPEEWDCTKLDDFISFISYGFTNPMPSTEDGVFMVTAADVEGGRINYETARYTSREAYERKLTAKSKPKPKDVLLTKDGALGRVAVVGHQPICINQSVAVLRPNARANSECLAAVLQSDFYQRKMLEDAGGSTIKHIYITIVNQMPIALPQSLPEQQAIAEALGDADALIEALEALIAKKRDIKQGAMQDLLTGHRRLPGFHGEWVDTTLGDCLERPPFYGINAAAAPYADILPRYLRITDIDDDGRLVAGSFASVDHPLSQNYLLLDGDVVLARTGASVGKSFAYSVKLGPLVFAGFLICARPLKSKLVSGFLAGVLKTRLYWSWVASVSMRSGQPGINSQQYSSMPVSLPTLDEQYAIAAVLSDMDAEIAALEDKLAKARDVKQGMMQALLTGEVRLV